MWKNVTVQTPTSPTLLQPFQLDLPTSALSNQSLRLEIRREEPPTAQHQLVNKTLRLHKFPLSGVDLLCGQQCLAHHVLILVSLILRKRKDQVIRYTDLRPPA